MFGANSPEVARTVHAAGLFTHLWRSAAQMRTDVPARWASYVDLLDVDVLPEEVRLRKSNQRELVRPIQFDPATGRGQGPIERGRVAPEAKRVFIDVDLCEASPQVRLPVVPLDRALQPALERSMR